MLTSQLTSPQNVVFIVSKKQPAILYPLRWNAMSELSETFYLSIMKDLEGQA